MSDSTGNGTIQTKHVKEFAGNNKLITTLVTAVIAIFSGGGVANFVSSDSNSDNAELMEYRLRVAEEGLKEQATEIEDLTKTLWKNDIFSVFWDDGIIYASSPPEYLNRDSGSFLWAKDKMLSKDCKFATRTDWLKNDANKKRKKSQKLKSTTGPELYPRLVYDFEEKIPYIYYSKSKRKVWNPIHEDRAATDWQVFSCIEKDRSI